MKTILQPLAASLPAFPALVVGAAIQHGEMAGCLFGPAEKVPEAFNGSFSLYAAAWPLVETYLGHRFQTGLYGTWMHPQYEADKKPEGTTARQSIGLRHVKPQWSCGRWRNTKGSSGGRMLFHSIPCNGWQVSLSQDNRNGAIIHVEFEFGWATALEAV